MYSENNRGPIIDPCGTPRSEGRKFVKTLSKQTACFLSLRYDEEEEDILKR